MSITTGQNALINHFLGMSPSEGVVLPNDRGLPAPPPRYVVQVTAGSQQTLDFDGQVDARPEIVIRVDVDADTGVSQSQAMVDALVSRFAVNTKIGDVLISQPAFPQGPLSANGVYSIPVIIRGRYCFTTTP
ncbi:MAG: hypothetical protein AAFY43_07345 [Pseudomonadota bacterium]